MYPSLVIYLFLSSASMVHIDMENFILQSCLDNDRDHSTQFRFYHRYRLNISNQQLIYSELGILLFLIHRRSFLQYYRSNTIPCFTTYFIDADRFLQMYLLGWCIFTRVRTDEDRHSSFYSSVLHSWRIAVTIGPKVQIELSKGILHKLIQHAQSVPLIYSNMIDTIYRINLYCKRFISVFISSFSMLVFSCYFPTLYNAGSWSIRGKILSSSDAISRLDPDRQDFFSYLKKKIEWYWYANIVE